MQLLSLASYVILALGAPAAPAQPALVEAPFVRSLQQQLDGLISEAGYPGLTLGYALADGTSGSLAAGFADLEERLPMRPNDVMLTGSVGKIFCAAVILQLVQEHKLALDDPIATWIGGEDWFTRLPNGACCSTIPAGFRATSSKKRFRTTCSRTPNGSGNRGNWSPTFSTGLGCSPPGRDSPTPTPTICCWV